jgi:hypothetical protein
MPKKKPKKGKPEVHEELEGFDIKINEFGEIVSNFSVEKINEFLDENVKDKKLMEKEASEKKVEEESEEDSEDEEEENE